MLEVSPGSPLHIAGLKAEEDYLLGTAERVFKDPDILFDEVTTHLDQPMEFYVYSTKTDQVMYTMFFRFFASRKRESSCRSLYFLTADVSDETDVLKKTIGLVFSFFAKPSLVLDHHYRSHLPHESKYSLNKK